jgi:ABC-type dipeptide/oligopeptide/nickel transport system permease component
VEAAPVIAQPGTRMRDRALALLLLVLRAVGCLAIWVVVPAGVLSALAHATEDQSVHLVAGVILVPTAMFLFAALLLRLNYLYLRVTGVLDRWDDEGDEPRHLRGPLEPLLLGSLAIQIVALAVWLAFFGDVPQVQVM